MENGLFEGQIGGAMPPRIVNLFCQNSTAWGIIMEGHASLPEEQGIVWLKNIRNIIADFNAKQERATIKSLPQSRILEGDTVGTIPSNIVKIFRENSETWESIIEGHASLPKNQGLLWLSDCVNDITSRQKALGNGIKKA